MKITDSNKTPFKPAPVGSHVVRLIQMIDLGNQEFKGKVSRKIYLGFELPLETMENGKPFTVGKEVTASLSVFQGRESTLRQIATALHGGNLKEADLEALKENVFILNGKVGMANVCHKTSAAGNVRADLVNVVPLAKGMSAPAAVNELVTFDLDNIDEKALEKVPAFLKRKMKIGVNDNVDGLDEVLGE